MRTVVMLGGTGFVGSAVARTLLAHGMQVVVASREPEQVALRLGSEVIGARYTSGEVQLPPSIRHADAIVNLAGVSLSGGRWTKQRKRAIVASRIEATRAAVALVKQMGASVLVNASAVGVYGTSDTQVCTEATAVASTDFLSLVCRQWEEAADRALDIGARVVKARLGVVLGRDQGALPQMVLPYRLYAGGPLGTGRQWVSWIHLNDAANLLELALHDGRINGAFNVTAPHPVRMNEFGQTVAKILGRPYWLAVPAMALRTILGEMAGMVLEGQCVLPRLAQACGYHYQFATVESALEDLL